MKILGINVRPALIAAMALLYYLDYLPGSAVYYSRGKAVRMTGAGPESPQAEFWLAAHKTLGDVSRWECSVKLRPATGMFNLYLCRK